MEILTNETLLSQQGHILVGALGLPAEGDNRSGVSSPTNNSVDQGYLEGLVREREALAIGPGMDLSRRLLNQEIEKIQNGGKVVKTDDKKMSDVTKDKSVKLTVKVLVPVKDHPKFNFVGKLLGPKGNSLKRLQEETMTKMAILGRGSMRDKQKEEELRLSGDQKFNHLSEDLHVEVAAVAPPAEAHARIAYALTEIRRYLVPDYNDDIRQEQMREMQIINSSSSATSANTSSGPSCSNNGAISGSEEGSCSPLSSAGGEVINQQHQSPPHHTNNNTTMEVTANGRRNSTNKIISNPSIPLTSTHPAFRGLNNRSQTTIVNAKDTNASKSRGSSQGRRSVLSLLTKARAIQQKEHEFMGVFHDMSSYNVYEHLGELPISDQTTDDIIGRSIGALKAITSPNERARFRHDPYQRITSST